MERWRSHTRRSEATSEEWMNDNLELTISRSIAHGAATTVACEMMEIPMVALVG